MMMMCVKNGGRKYKREDRIFRSLLMSNESEYLFSFLKSPRSSNEVC